MVFPPTRFHTKLYKHYTCCIRHIRSKLATSDTQDYSVNTPGDGAAACQLAGSLP